jgi:RhtB (resistance to homoserine/threonine) family protein
MVASLFLIFAVFCVAVISPGPDFFITLRNAMRHGTKAGVLTALGIASGAAVHMSYCIAGIGLLIARSILLFDTVKWIGAAYLFYIGVQSLRSKGMQDHAGEAETARPVLGSFGAFRSGFVTNLFNPKATMFFLALFSQMLKPDTPALAMATLVASCLAMVFLWFSAVSAIVTAPPLRLAYMRASKWIDRTAGVLFVGLGVKLAATRL